MKSLLALILLALASAAAAQTTSANPHEWHMRAGDKPEHISEHVWMVKGNPNIAFVVGSRSVLVVDTGMGPANGTLAAKFATELAPGRRLILTTTHFHPEHAAGDNGFPIDTLLIRNDVQQQQVEKNGMEMVKLFMSRSDENRGLLSDVHFRTPDALFHDTLRLNLGGVSVRLLWLGKAHTAGDELVFVEPDATLISGDVVQNNTTPMIFTQVGEGGTPTSWIKVVDRIALLHAQHVVPDHSLPGDGSLVSKERALLAEIRTAALAAKQHGTAADQAGKDLSAKLKQEHPDWYSTDVTDFVRKVYADPDTQPL